MDNRAFIQRLAKATETDTKTTQTLVSALTALIAEAAIDLDSVALPGFGSFTPAKTPDHVETDSETGRQRLVPPHINIVFKAGSHLKKTLKSRP